MYIHHIKYVAVCTNIALVRQIQLEGQSLVADKPHARYPTATVNSNLHTDNRPASNNQDTHNPFDDNRVRQCSTMYK